MIHVNWKNSESYLMLNPKLPQRQNVELQELYAKINRRLQLDSMIWITSSGSSKRENESVKLIALRKEAFLISAQAVNNHLNVSAKDKWIQVLPRFHVGGLSIEARAYLSGVEVVNLEKWDAKNFVQIAQDAQATLSAMVPTQVYDLVQAKLSPPSSLRAVVIGGSAISKELYMQARELGWPLLPSFGMTECCSQIATAELESLEKKIVLSAEFPKYRVLEHCKVRVNDSGFLQIKTNSLMNGYAQMINQKANWYPIESFNQQDWFTTQDRTDVFIDNEKTYISHAMRDSEYIKIKGEGISLARLRELFASVTTGIAPDLLMEFAIDFRSNKRAENEIVLFHTKEVPLVLIQKLTQEFNKKVMPVERITQVIGVCIIPRSPLGKILYREIN